MIHRAYALSSTTEAFNTECAKLRSTFSRLDYPVSLINSAINNFLFRNSSANTVVRNNDDSSTVRISLPFKDQVAANAVRKQLRDLSHKIGPTLQPVFVSKKLGQESKTQRNQAVNCESAVCCLPFFMWSVRCRLCRVHSPTPSSTHCWAQKFGDR